MKTLSAHLNWMKVEMDEITIDSKKVAIFTDIHWGKSRDIETKINTNIEFMRRFTEFVKNNSITDTIFMGDWFDNRNVISVKTQNVAYKCLKDLAAHTKIYMIVGNHDAYFKESIEVNSIKPYADISNVFPIERNTKINFLPSKKTALMCPWSSFRASELTEKFDVMFGHFEFQGAVLKGAVHDGGEAMHTLTSFAPIVFSGHFHIRKEYPQFNGKVITAGSPAELDWGDADNVKGHYTINTETMEYTFYENDFSPRHRRIYWSKIRSKQETFQNIRGNYIKLVIDEKYKFENVMKVINLINSQSPIKPCETDFIYNNNFSSLANNYDFSPSEEVFSLTKLQYIEKFVEHIEENLEDLDKKKLLSMINEYYQLAENKK